MFSFEFATANRIVFGAGKLNELGRLIEQNRKHFLLVRGQSSDAIPRVRNILSSLDSSISEFQVHGEPTIDVVRAGLEAAQDCDTVIGLGGGSVLDTGKAISALVTNPGEITDYLEVVGKGRPLVNPPLPYIAIPTTSGTGTEVTRNAVIEATDQNVKVSLRSPLMLPRLALIDPELTYSLPPEITAATGLDALTQLIEPFVSIKANPMTNAICREGIQNAARSLKRAYENGSDQQARQGMSLAALCGGLALANAGLGAVHGFAGALGGMLHAPHGAICARLLPFVMEANLRALQARQPGHPAIARYQEIAKILTGDGSAATQEGVEWVSRVVIELKIPQLSQYGMNKEQFSEAVEKTIRSSSFKGNPILLNAMELAEILEKAF
jgi:alcohol dehydrogenase class IV